MIKRAAFLAIVAAAPLAAQSPLPLPANHPRVKAALDVIKADKAWTFQQQQELTAIPAPPFKESARAAEFKKRDIYFCFFFAKSRLLKFDYEGAIFYVHI